MKKIALAVLLSTSGMYSNAFKLQQKITSPITYQVASSVAGYFLKGLIKSAISNDKLRGGIAIVGILGGIALHKIYFKPALDEYKARDEYNKSTAPNASAPDAKNNEFPSVQALVTFGINTLGYAALWSSPSLVKNGLNFLEKVNLLDVSKVAAPAALMGYGVISALD